MTMSVSLAVHMFQTWSELSLPNIYNHNREKHWATVSIHCSHYSENKVEVYSPLHQRWLPTTDTSTGPSER